MKLKIEQLLFFMVLISLSFILCYLPTINILTRQQQLTTVDVRRFKYNLIGLALPKVISYNDTIVDIIVRFIEFNIADKQSSSTTSWLAFISCNCDSSNTVGGHSIFSFPADHNVVAVILNKVLQEKCHGSYTLMNESTDYDHSNEGTNVINQLQTRNDISHQTTPHTPNDNNNTSNTSLAMIILYVIIVVITIMFLIVITTGALRYFRNPRYQPRPPTRRLRNTTDGPVVVEDRGMSRAGGLARAILETFPLIKFDDNVETHSHNDANKRSDIEMNERISNNNDEEKLINNNDNNDNHESCAICYDDFTNGEDIRILPCDGQHRFHATCVDPWLLNVSSACPLCRQDFGIQSVVEGQNANDAIHNESRSSVSSATDNSNQENQQLPLTISITDPRDNPPLITANNLNRGQASLQSLRNSIRSTRIRLLNMASDENNDNNRNSFWSRLGFRSQSRSNNQSDIENV